MVGGAFGAAGFVGVGNMGGAIASGVLAAGVVPKGRIFGCDASSGRATEIGLVNAGNAAGVIRRLDEAGGGALVLAVKPQVLPLIAGDLRQGFALASSRIVLVSVLAGVRSGLLAEFAGGNPVVRAMPNTPARLGAGVTAVSGGPGAEPADVASVCSLFKTVGPVVIEIAEELMDVFTVLAGSGPAYVFRLAEVLSEAGAALGLSEADAARAVRQTIIGAARLLEDDPAPASVLRAAVTSPGGTTAAALEALEAGGIGELFARAIERGRDRGGELAAMAETEIRNRGV